MVTSGTGHPGARLLAPGPLGARDATVSGDDEKISKATFGFKRGPNFFWARTPT
jgi:hypothetical protein